MNMTKISFELENQCQGTVAGIDEAGCGPWAGPVVAAAVIIDQPSFPKKFLHEVNDSKKLSKKKRGELYQELINHSSITYHIGISSIEEIDQLNIWGATQLAMFRAVEGLALKPTQLLIDGKRKPNFDQFSQPNKLDVESILLEPSKKAIKVQRQRFYGIPRLALHGHGSANSRAISELSGEGQSYIRAIIKGDNRCFSIATASILAKVKRDEIMNQLHQEYPHFDWHKNAGYGTLGHHHAIMQYGVTPHHRKSFAPIRSLISQVG